MLMLPAEAIIMMGLERHGRPSQRSTRLHSSLAIASCSRGGRCGRARGCWFHRQEHREHLLLLLITEAGRCRSSVARELSMLFTTTARVFSGSEIWILSVAR